MAYVPDDWVTAAYDHTVSFRNVGLFGLRTMYLCTCGISSFNYNDFWNQHIREEEASRQFLRSRLRIPERKYNSPLESLD